MPLLWSDSSMTSQLCRLCGKKFTHYHSCSRKEGNVTHSITVQVFSKDKLYPWIERGLKKLEEAINDK